MIGLGRHEGARSGKQLAKLAVPGPEAEPGAFVGGELEAVASHERHDCHGIDRFRARRRSKDHSLRSLAPDLGASGMTSLLAQPGKHREIAG